MLLALLVLFAAPAPKFEFWPGATYDPHIPTMRQVLGYDGGERISAHAEIMKYFEALAAASPRVRIFEYGQSWEGRRLIYAAIGSEANIRRLEEIRAGMKRLADPRKTAEADARRLIASLPAIVWLGYGVHGNEISSPDAAMLTAYHLLAARNDQMVEAILKNVVVMIAPTQNPDGRDRFIHDFEQAEGLEPDASPLAAEHIEPWPGGRGNHYLFDMNRDWFALTQPEIHGQVKALQEWYPEVVVDLHEMGSESTYYFAPGADPFNPHLTGEQKQMLTWFGKNNARWFDRFGFDYFTRDVFDAFYPGYGDSWPAYYGGIGMTYEQASARGLLMRRSNDTTFQFRDTVRQHFVTSLATAETAAVNREKLLDHFYRYRTTAIEEGKAGPVREYILARAGDTSAVDKLAWLLSEQGVEIRRTATPFKTAEREFPAGSYGILLAQPAGRLVRTLLETNVPMDAAFVKEQDRLRRKRLPDEVYDVTAWSLPLAYNVEVVGLSAPAQGSFEPVRPERIPAGTVAAVPKPVAYLAPGSTQATARLLATAFRQGLTMLCADRAFTQNGKKYAAGTLIFKVQGNPPDLAARLEKLAHTTGATIQATESSWVDSGPNFGSRYVVQLRKPTIALAWDRPVSSSSAGWTRFVLERQYNYPVTAVRTPLLKTADLSRFQVIILPSGSGAAYTEVLGANGARRLKEWVGSGGTLVAFESAVSFLADPKVGLLAVAQENVPKPAEEPRKTEAPKPEPGARVPGKLLANEAEYLKAIQPENDLPDRVLGVMLKARPDPDHWLTAGLPDTLTALVDGREVYTPIKLDKGVNAAVFLGPDQLVASGQMWEEARKQFAFKPLVIVQREGRGQTIAFTADPNFRAYLDGLNVLFLNAVLRGPAHVRTGIGESDDQ